MNGVNVCGFIGGETGLTQSAHNCIHALKAVGIPYGTINHPTIGKSDRWPDKDTDKDTYIFHCNPDVYSAFFRHLGRSLDGKRLIAYWHWEQENIPDNWLPWIARFSEVWSPSGFVADAVSKHTQTKVIPHAIAISGEPRRKDYRIPNSSFAVLVMFDALSDVDRKNPLAAVAAFKKAAIADSVLVVKSHHLQPRKAKELERALAGVRHIWINRTLSRMQVNNLIASCDVLLSMHRSEGYGLHLAEAMALGVPVVATGWSGNMEFMRTHNSCLVDYELRPFSGDRFYGSGRWACPYIESASDWLRRLATDQPFRHLTSAAGANWIRLRYSPLAIGELYHKALR